MNRLDTDARARVITCLIEGCSIRSTVRMTGVSKKAVMRLLVDVGTVAAQYQDEKLRNLSTKRLQLDELWTFLVCKRRNVTPEIAAKNPHAGDIWLWTALDADSKLMVSWRVGRRDLATAYDFTHDLAERLKNRVQITTDGFKVYLEAVESAFNEEIDYAMLQKVYGADQQARNDTARRRSSVRRRRL